MKKLTFPRGRIGSNTVTLRVSDNVVLTQDKADSIVMTARSHYDPVTKAITYTYEPAVHDHSGQTGLYSLASLLYGRAYFGAYRHKGLAWDDFTREAYTSKSLQAIRGEHFEPKTAGTTPVQKTPQEILEQLRKRSQQGATVVKEEPTATTAFKEIFFDLFGKFAP